MAYIGVDVGTGSARAGVFDPSGQLLGAGSRDITLHRGPGAMVEQSSDEIWAAVSASVRAAMAEAGLTADDVKGLGFDATCSLVVLDAGGHPLPVGPSEDPSRNIIVWMDHRAVEQAERINTIGHPVLGYVGGRISPEMQTPKLLWLKENRPEIYARAAHFFDLSDFLSWRATGDLTRSACTVVCKWTYLGHEGRWDPSYFKAMGLQDLAAEGFARIGSEVAAPGTSLGRGLSAAAAQELGLHAGTPVGASLIDAHAGGIGTVGCGSDPTRTMAYVFGTSSCTMTTSASEVAVPGVWGPYHGAMVPGHWLLEGGQSAAGSAIDRLLASHPHCAQATAKARAVGKSLPVWLGEQAIAAAGSPSEAVKLAKGLHVVPEFLGNRAPFANPHSRAMIAGLGFEDDLASLLAVYVAGLCGISYGLRQIIEAQAAAGADMGEIVVSGGVGQSALAQQILADVTELPVRVPSCPEPVLLGAAMLGASAQSGDGDLSKAMRSMSDLAKTVAPESHALHGPRYATFLKMQAIGLDQQTINS